MKKILVPTDFSKFADAARDYAIDIAKKTGAEVHFEHTMLVAVDWENMNENDRLLYPELKKAIEDFDSKLDKLVNDVKEKGIKAEKRLTFNEGLIDIPGDIKEQGYDLAIMGSHGEKGIKSVLLGSNAQRMIRYSPCPVLVVKDKNDQPKFDRIAIASTFEDEARKGYDELISFAKLVNAKVTLLYINTPVNFETSDESLKKLKKFRDKYPDIVEDVQIFNHYTEDEGIMKYIESEKPYLLGIATHGRKGWKRVFSGSITESLVTHGEFPVLSVNLNKE